MNRKEVFAIGVMSGTSLDGIDLVYVKFLENNVQYFEILHAETVAYSEKWKSTLQKAIHFSSEDLALLNTQYGHLLGELIADFIKKNQLQHIHFIASHGHTILHQPNEGITLQIGSGQMIANVTKQQVVCDFRTQDVLYGGQGAPLVPIGDELLFSKYDFCLNLGGFSNVSYLEKGTRIAFDICPVNIVLNAYAQRLGVDFDDAGVLSSQGSVNLLLLEKLNSLSYYKEKPPKSLGLEWVQAHVFPLIDRLETDVLSVLRTFVEHIAMQISQVIYQNDSVLITGGGVFNSFLIKRIEAISEIKIAVPQKELINYKEALIFAFLGLLKVQGQVNCLSSVTGAKKDHSSGVIFLPEKHRSII